HRREHAMDVPLWLALIVVGALGAVLVSMLLAVAITSLALSISGVVLLVLVRMLRQEFRR
ncbi:hypothetical protein ACFW0I_38615, partial [[Kitasatospora] papulosa]